MKKKQISFVVVCRMCDVLSSPKCYWCHQCSVKRKRCNSLLMMWLLQLEVLFCFHCIDYCDFSLCRFAYIFSLQYWSVFSEGHLRPRRPWEQLWLLVLLILTRCDLIHILFGKTWKIKRFIHESLIRILLYCRMFMTEPYSTIGYCNMMYP